MIIRFKFPWKNIKKHLTFSGKIPYYICVPASTIDACPAEQCVRHFFYKDIPPKRQSEEIYLNMDKKRINVYIDGFNLYHSTLQHTHPDCRWLNLREIANRLINPNTEEVKDVFYFSALTTWIPERAKKHLLYIHALRTVGVKDILGKFSIRERKCPLCSKRYQAHEEKKTDINIAINLLADAVADKYDTALILSGDSDLAPVTTKLKELCPCKKIGILIPKGQSAMNLKQHADFFKLIQAKDLKKSLLPRQVLYNGKTIIAPVGWLP